MTGSLVPEINGSKVSMGNEVFVRGILEGAIARKVFLAKYVQSNNIHLS
jgi:hypothetical protein